MDFYGEIKSVISKDYLW